MNDNMFMKDYKMSVDTICIPDDYKSRILSNLKTQFELPQETDRTCDDNCPYNEKVISINSAKTASVRKEKTKGKNTKIWLSLVASLVALVVGASVLFSIMPVKQDLRLVTINVASATNLAKVRGASIRFISSSGEVYRDRNGEVVDVLTNENGVATAQIPDEEGYIAEVSVDGYISTRQSVDEENIYISPVMDENTYRAVLTWDKMCDLDAHLSVTNDKGTQSLHYFDSDAVNDDGEVFAALDVDNETGEGPETITFNVQENSLMRFSVVAYAPPEENPLLLSQSGAKVTVYKGDACVGEYNLDSDEQGNVWCVFEVDTSDFNVCDYIYSVSAVTEVK